MTARGCPKGVRKRTYGEIREAILAELQRGDRTASQLQKSLRLAKALSYRYLSAMVDEGVIHERGKHVKGTGGVSPMRYGLRKREAPEVRTTIRGPWPVSVPDRRAT